MQHLHLDPSFAPRRSFTLTPLAAALSLAMSTGTFTFSAHAANYTAANETELRAAINSANADSDPSATITLTANIPLASTPAFPALTKPLTINTNGFVLSGFDQPAGTGNAGTLQFSGNTLNILGTLRGGNGASSTGSDGAGGAGLTLVSGASLINNGTIIGGNGGDNLSGVGTGGPAGTGAVLTGGSHVNNGTIRGGLTGANLGGFIRGGNGVTLSNGSLVNNGLIEAGDGNFYGSNAGVELRNTATLINNGTIEGSSNIPTANTGSVNVGIRVSAGGTATIINTGTIRGGTGGSFGGQAIYILPIGSTTENLTVINSGTIAAGTGATQAILFDNTASALSILELRAGSNIVGQVVARAAVNANDIFRLGGDTNSTFDISSIGAAAQYRGFDTFQKTGASTWTLTGTSAQALPWQVTNGTLALAPATSLIAGSNITIASGSTFGGYGSVTGTINNAGTLAIANAIPALSGGGIGTLNITGDLTNAGSIQIGGQGVGNQLVVAGNYTGNNGLIRLNSTLGADGSPSDRLVLDGGTASGTTGLVITNVGGGGLPIVSDGIEVIRAQNGATSTASAFSLAAPVKAGVYEYYLAKGGLSGGTQENWYLRNFLVENNVPTTPLFRREAPIYSEFGNVARELGLQQLGTFRDRRSDQIMAENAELAPAWMRVWGSDTELSPASSLDQSFDGSMFGFQLGHDLYRTETDHGHRNQFGVMGGVARAIGDVDGFASGRENLHVGNLAINQYSLGGYWTHLSPGGWYTDLTLTGSVLRIDGQSNDGGGDKTDGNAITGAIETGLPIHLGERLVFEPQAQLVWQRLWIDDLNDGYSTVGFEENNTYRARLGATLRSDITMNNMQWQPYIKANVLRYSGNEDETTFGGGSVMRTRVGQTSGQLAAGIVGKLNAFSSVYATASYQTNLDDQDQRILAGNVGVQLLW
ncbi:MAG TPA: autotransporter outer membrane beta-barrel domain-containing protein [Methylophilaceae bacterium]|nr:autotransporter outer membrane beta-barrel domain-containing protein [Methylophilaceae bacterium]